MNTHYKDLLQYRLLTSIQYANCLVISFTLANGDKKYTATDVRLPLMQSGTLMSLNMNHFSGFVGPIGRWMKPALQVTSKCALFKTDATLNSLAGKELVVPHNYQRLLEKTAHVFRPKQL